MNAIQYSLSTDERVAGLLEEARQMGAIGRSKFPQRLLQSQSDQASHVKSWLRELTNSSADDDEEVVAVRAFQQAEPPLFNHVVAIESASHIQQVRLALKHVIAIWPLLSIAISREKLRLHLRRPGQRPEAFEYCGATMSLARVIGLISRMNFPQAYELLREALLFGQPIVRNAAAKGLRGWQAADLESILQIAALQNALIKAPYKANNHILRRMLDRPSREFASTAFDLLETYPEDPLLSKLLNQMKSFRDVT